MHWQSESFASGYRAIRISHPSMSHSKVGHKKKTIFFTPIKEKKVFDQMISKYLLSTESNCHHKTFVR